MFVFNLQSVLDARKVFEEKILREFAEKKRELEKEVESLLHMRKRRESAVVQLKGLKDQGVMAADVTMYFNYINRLVQQESMQEDIIHQMEKQVEMKRQELIEAVKDRKVMESLKERKWEEYYQKVSSTERKLLDEMAIVRFDRRRSDRR